MGWVNHGLGWDVGLGCVGLDRLDNVNFISVIVVAIVTVIVRLDYFATVCMGGIRHIITDIRSGSVLYFQICYI